MNNNLFRIYNSCFPNYPVKEEVFQTKHEVKPAHIIYAYNNGNIIGYSIVRGNSILLLCIENEHHKKGFGSGLLKESEDYIKANGSDKVVLGGSLFQGVPADDYNIVSFFEKRGYKAKWTSVNMRLQISEFDADKFKTIPEPNSIEFRFIQKNDKNNLLAAVKDVEEDWLEFFINCDEPIMAAVSDNEIIGFQILSVNRAIFAYNDSSIGCLGVINKAQNKGIGARLFAEGVEWLKNQGCKSVELFYTYDELINWYGKFGAKVNSKQWMGEKAI